MDEESSCVLLGQLDEEDDDIKPTASNYHQKFYWHTVESDTDVTYQPLLTSTDSEGNPSMVTTNLKEI